MLNGDLSERRARRVAAGRKGWLKSSSRPDWAEICKKGGHAEKHFTPESKQRQIEGGRQGGKMGRGGAPRGNLNGVKDGAYSERAMRALGEGSLKELSEVMEAIRRRRDGRQASRGRKK